MNDLTARIDALIAPLPGKMGRRYELDFPTEGQFGVIWEDIAVEDLTPEMHHFDGLDFKILAERDEALKGDPSWEFMAQALPLLVEARAQIAAQAEALAATGKADRLIREWFAAFTDVNEADGPQSHAAAMTRKLHAEMRMSVHAAPEAAATFGITSENIGECL